MKRELAMDLGTANTIIISDGEIAVNEPSVVALDPTTEKTIAVGERAKLMYEKDQRENPCGSPSARWRDCGL